MGLLKRLLEWRAERRRDREAIARASSELLRVGDEPSEEELDAAADRVGSMFPGRQ